MNVFILNNNKYYVFLEKHKNIIELNLKKHFLTIKNIEKPIINTIENIKELEKLETLLRMIKYGFNNVYGWKFTNIHISLKEYELIRNLIKENIHILNNYNINNNWENDLNKCIEKEKLRHKNTTCFICAKKGHFAINCKENFDIDGEYIGEDKQCKYCKKIIEKKNIIIHEKNCKKYYSY